MKIICPQCSAEYEIQSNVVGQKVECQRCKFQWVVALKPVSAPKMKPCPICGENILAAAKKCRYCGEYLTADVIPIHRKNRSIYCLLGIFLGGWGIHNFYAGQFPAGIGKLFLTAYGIAIASSKPEEIWGVAVLILYFVIWDLCYDPNIPTDKRKKILGLSPGLISVLLPFVLFAVIGGIWRIFQK